MIKGKITVKHFLNLKVKPLKTMDNKNAYPVYVRIIFNRKQTDFKSIAVNDYLLSTGRQSAYLSEKQFNKPDQVLAEIIESERLDIYLVIDLFRNRDFNILDYQVQQLMELCLAPTKNIVLNYFKRELAIRTREIDTDNTIYKIINWHQAEFLELYSAFMHWGIFKKEIELEFSGVYRLLTNPNSVYNKMVVATPKLYQLALGEKLKGFKRDPDYGVISWAITNYFLLINARIGKVFLPISELQ